MYKHQFESNSPSPWKHTQNNSPECKSQALSFKMPVVQQIVLFKIFRCAVGVRLYLIVYNFTRFWCAENGTPECKLSLRPTVAVQALWLRKKKTHRNRRLALTHLLTWMRCYICGFFLFVEFTYSWYIHTAFHHVHICNGPHFCKLHRSQSNPSLNCHKYHTFSYWKV